MPNPCSIEVSDAGPQSIAEVWTTSGARTLWRVKAGFRSSSRIRRDAGGSQDKSHRRQALDLHLDGARQPMHHGDCRARLTLQRDLDADHSLRRLAGDMRHPAFQPAEAGPRVSLELQPGRLA